ncbi:hypothetical protein PVAG01_09989 [Phlyctema vagabunda]|uniref:Atos-like conserved domain-containing protein n=1 Tax=Phlyctema vagabunda TaxID=108571 RepID=A0ABR4P4P4_9HELO
MPIFQDDLGGGPQPPPRESTTPVEDAPTRDKEMRRKASEESIRTDFCDGPLPDSPILRAGTPVEQGETFIFPSHGTSDRVELIQRLKRGESPTWLPNRNVLAGYYSANLGRLAPSPQLEAINSLEQQSPLQSSPNPSPLLPPVDFTGPRATLSGEAERIQAGSEIERPRSALHSGDFTEAGRGADSHAQLDSTGLFLSPAPKGWFSTSPPRDFNLFNADTSPGANSLDPGRSYRAPSISSYSSSFVLKPPTSPLVQSESNDDLELSSFMHPIDINMSFQRNARRHTLQSAQSMQSNLSASSFSTRPLPHLRRDNTHPYQAHQPRRSLTLDPTSPYPSPSPQTPAFLRSRKQSFVSENSPLLHASMVGSYEESIIRGRMSTTPSKPLDFVAQIGVLGLGKCKASLKCPPHVTIPFPAVFYSYETTSHGRSGSSEDGPSPYVGQVDLENGLPHADEARESNRKRRTTTLDRQTSEDFQTKNTSIRAPLTEHQELRRAEKQKRRSASPRAPLGGSYRIPEKGQLQIIIKNPNKTAVKLFLVPYDLTGMEPGTKTFIRQRSYSAGPIINSAISSTAQQPASSPFDRPTLRYLIHLHICCPSRGRYFLYKSIRVVFANRVPDGKEKLKNEISLPEPRFSVYKSSREAAISGGAGAALAAEKAYRRRSYGYPLASSQHNYDGMEGIRQAFEGGVGNKSATSNLVDSGTYPVDPIPFHFSRGYNRNESETGAEKSMSEILSPTSSKSSRPNTSQGPDMSMSWNSNSTNISNYGKLNKGDAGYGGIFSGSPDGKQVIAESLLAKKLKGLGVGMSNTQDRLDGV